MGEAVYLGWCFLAWAYGAGCGLAFFSRGQERAERAFWLGTVSALLAAIGMAYGAVSR